jgi:hypothetical protein
MADDGNRGLAWRLRRGGVVFFSARLSRDTATPPGTRVLFRYSSRVIIYPVTGA